MEILEAAAAALRAAAAGDVTSDAALSVMDDAAARAAAAAALATLAPPPVALLEARSRDLAARRAAPRVLGDWAVVTVATIISPPGPVRVLVGGTVTFTVAGRQATAAGAPRPVWVSSSEGTAVVRPGGVVAAVAPGSSVVTLERRGSSSSGDATTPDAASDDEDGPGPSSAAAAGRTVDVRVVTLAGVRLEWEDDAAHARSAVGGAAGTAAAAAEPEWTPSAVTDAVDHGAPPRARRLASVLGRRVPGGCAGRADAECARPWLALSRPRLDVDPMDADGLELPREHGDAVDHGLRVRCSAEGGADPGSTGVANPHLAVVAVGPGTALPTADDVTPATGLPRFVLDAAARRLRRRVFDAECLVVPRPPPPPPAGSSILLARPMGQPPASFAVAVHVSESAVPGSGRTPASASSRTTEVPFRPAPLLSRSSAEPRLSNGTAAVPGCPRGSLVLTSSAPSYLLFAYGRLAPEDAAIHDPADASRLEVRAAAVAGTPTVAPGAFRPVALRVTVAVAPRWLRADARAGDRSGASFLSRGVRVTDPATGLTATAPVCFLRSGDAAVDGPSAATPAFAADVEASAAAREAGIDEDAAAAPGRVAAGPDAAAYDEPDGLAGDAAGEEQEFGEGAGRAAEVEADGSAAGAANATAGATEEGAASEGGEDEAAGGSTPGWVLWGGIAALLVLVWFGLRAGGAAQDGPIAQQNQRARAAKARRMGTGTYA